MVFPDKHIRFSESLLGLGSLVLESLSKPKNIDELWKELKGVQQTQNLFITHNFENLVLATDILYAIGMIENYENGTLRYVKNLSSNKISIKT